MRNFKIVLSVIFVLLIAFVTVRSCAPIKKVTGRLVGKPVKPVKIVVRPKTVAPGPAPVIGAAKMAIILDDWGVNRGLVYDVIRINRPITLAVIPHLEHSREIAEIAHEHGLGVMLHMPMEPKSTKERLEPHTIMTVSSDEDILHYTDEGLLSVPYAEGVNNHMGSAATSDPRVMRTFLKRLKSKNLFFVDSYVIPTTVARWVAQEQGLYFATRDVFIDNQLNSDAIKKQLLKARLIALKTGKVVVIGHDHRITINAIAQMVPELERDGIQFVLARDLVEKTRPGGKR